MEFIQVREALKLTQRAMAKKLEITPSYLCQIEKGKVPVSEKLQAKLEIVKAELN